MRNNGRAWLASRRELEHSATGLKLSQFHSTLLVSRTEQCTVFPILPRITCYYTRVTTTCYHLTSYHTGLQMTIFTALLNAFKNDCHFAFSYKLKSCRNLYFSINHACVCCCRKQSREFPIISEYSIWIWERKKSTNTDSFLCDIVSKYI